MMCQCSFEKQVVIKTNLMEVRKIEMVQSHHLSSKRERERVMKR